MQIVSIRGFDADGEPEIRVMADGTLQVLFNFMPPSDARDEEEGLFAQFEEHLAKAIGSPVIREDRERFLVRSPAGDTRERLVRFLEQCRRGPVRSGPAARPGVRSALYDGLVAQLSPHGFRLRKGEQAFIRNIPAGKQKLFVGWVDQRPHYRFSLSIGVRLDAVEEIVNRFAGLAPEFQQQSTTTTTQLEYFGLKPERGTGVWFSVTAPEEVTPVLGELTPLFRDQILPFVARFQNVPALDQGLHTDHTPGEEREAERKSVWRRWLQPRTPRHTPSAQEESAEAAWREWEEKRRAFDCTNHPVRRMRGLVVAHLAGNPRYEAWLARYRAGMAAFPEVEQRKFEELALYLRDR